MAQLHISKDPLDKTSNALGHLSFIGRQAQNPFHFRYVGFQNRFPNSPCCEEGIYGMRLILFLYILNNDKIYSRV
jgi:hypothetical protein